MKNCCGGVVRHTNKKSIEVEPFLHSEYGIRGFRTSPSRPVTNPARSNYLKGLSMIITDRHLDRYLAEITRVKWINLWNTRDAVHSALKYAFDEYSVGQDGKYSCDAVGCDKRVDTAGDYCNECYNARARNDTAATT